MILFWLMKVCCSCTALFGFAAEFGDDELDLLAEHALGHLRRDLLDQVVALVEMLDGELHALELVFALRGVRAGAGDSGADCDQVAPRAGRPGAERRLVLRIGPVNLAEKPGNQGGAGGASSETQHTAARKAASFALSGSDVRHHFLPWILFWRDFWATTKNENTFPPAC